MTLDKTTSKATYYVCEGSADAGLTKVTPTNDPQEALSIAQASKEKVHWVSTVNPLTEDVDNES
ncbi:hypothetical protein VF14_11595 [Nostoc linckia z18]|uniref:Uncharacterized protein n=2 Tax=Nostoc linckia TaxID=92942 RepID=A0A9Q5Z9W2_NOSLI|nr:hypothetical protein [Nostoc linckia]PHK40901.1 hypothetical protein VF12_08655 [Nostoc linckia z15]PHK46444.1 hypothetical protein VF13_10890 [Nostoc linckia z16]PHJ60244.1 hypothetical protein VF02_23045 [Nostoc linckia z1]PHJ63810.1 hypothetical protein VF05_24010 [Nostoc linckia z3]PHJ70824.1 hypothetical protein VF03_21580 [Nostoc linckia z2]